MTSRSNQMERNFAFSFPVDIFKDKHENWRIRGLASTEDKDLQNEIIKQDGLDISILQEGKGLINWEHRNTPEFLIGMVDSADITKDGLYISGQLFRKHSQARAVHQILESLDSKRKHRIQMSVEGKVLEKSDAPDGKSKIINRARISSVALTCAPVNPHTFLELAKSLTVKMEEPKNINIIDIEESIDYIMKKSDRNIIDVLKCLRNRLQTI